MMYLGKDPVGIVAGKQINWKNPFPTVYSCYHTFYQTELPETVIIDFEGHCPSEGLEGMFQRSTGWKHIIIKNLIMPDNGASMRYMFESNDNCEDVTFDNCRIRPSQCGRMLTGGYNGIKRINGQMDFIASTSDDPFYFARVLTHFEIAPNSMLRRYSLQYAGNFDDETLVSIANALNTENPASADLKRFISRMQSLMGNVENGLFILDENGTMTLYDFITTIKGWTIS